MKKAGVYKLTSPSGKCYIGQSVDLRRRFTEYRRVEFSTQNHLYNAVKKYGWDNFEVEILWGTNKPKRFTNLNMLLDTLEVAWIKKYDCVDSGYNIQEGGFKGYTIDAETRKKMSIAATGKKHSFESRRKMSASAKGRIFSEETRQKLSEVRMSKDPKDRRKMSKKVNQLDLQGNFIKVWDSVKDAASGVGLKSSSGISDVCRGKQKTSKGFKWEFNEG